MTSEVVLDEVTAGMVQKSDGGGRPLRCIHRGVENVGGNPDSAHGGTGCVPATRLDLEHLGLPMAGARLAPAKGPPQAAWR